MELESVRVAEERPVRLANPDPDRCRAGIAEFGLIDQACDFSPVRADFFRKVHHLRQALLVGHVHRGADQSRPVPDLHRKHCLRQDFHGQDSRCVVSLAFIAFQGDHGLQNGIAFACGCPWQRNLHRLPMGYFRTLRRSQFRPAAIQQFHGISVLRFRTAITHAYRVHTRHTGNRTGRPGDGNSLQVLAWSRAYGHVVDLGIHNGPMRLEHKTDHDRLARISRCLQTYAGISRNLFQSRIFDQRGPVFPVLGKHHIVREMLARSRERNPVVIETDRPQIERDLRIVTHAAIECLQSAFLGRDLVNQSRRAVHSFVRFPGQILESFAKSFPTVRKPVFQLFYPVEVFENISAGLHLSRNGHCHSPVRGVVCGQHEIACISALRQAIGVQAYPDGRVLP